MIRCDADLVAVPANCGMGANWNVFCDTNGCRSNQTCWRLKRVSPSIGNATHGRIKRFGIALHAGDSVMVTKVRLKDKVIEFQLGGGGYGTFWDESGSVSTTGA